MWLPGESRLRGCGERGVLTAVPQRAGSGCARLRLPSRPSPSILDALKAFAKGLFALCQNQQPPKAAPH